MTAAIVPNRSKQIMALVKSGEGTNRVIDMCKQHGAAPPVFEERSGFLSVTFRAQMVASTPLPPELQPESRPEISTSPVPVQYQSLEERVLALLREGALPVSILSQRLEQRRVSGQLKVVLNKLLSDAFVEFTIPDKPQSRLQKYRLSGDGIAFEISSTTSVPTTFRSTGGAPPHCCSHEVVQMTMMEHNLGIKVHAPALVGDDSRPVAVVRAMERALPRCVARPGQEKRRFSTPLQQ